MSGIPGFSDRAQMERERLARLAARRGTSDRKRERSITPPSLSRPAKIAKVSSVKDEDVKIVISSQSTDEDSSDLPKAARVLDLDSPSPPSSTKVASTPDVAIIPEPASSASTALRFPKGVVKKTWAFGHARTDKDIKIEEVLEKHTLRTAVLSAFQWDINWVMSKINLPQTKLIFVMQAKEQSLRDQMLKETEPLRKSLRLCFPSMEGQINCMHSKLMLLFHPDKLRVAVPSANLMSYDWGETGIMENSVFIIDLPRLPDEAAPDKIDGAEEEKSTSFRRELIYFLTKQGLDDSVLKGICNFDFSATKNISFVHSVGGAAWGKDMQRTGLMSLNQAVREQGLATEADLQLDFAASSIGSLNNSLLLALHAAARGATDLSPPAPKSSSATKTKTVDNIRDKIRIYFPTLDTVRNSTGGVDNGGTICLQRRWFESAGNVFPRECFRDYKSVRRGLLSHNKLLFARGRRPLKEKTAAQATLFAASSKNSSSSSSSSSISSRTKDKNNESKQDGDSEEAIAWIYAGSANMSESAWGKVVWDRSRKEWKINCRNWECGVLLPVVAPAAVEKQQIQKQSGSVDNKEQVIGVGKGKEKDGDWRATTSLEKTFSDVVEVPFELPGGEYEGREPWYFTEPHLR